jgi:hypothetical protein
VEAGRLRHGVRATISAVAACCVLLAASGCDAPPARAAQAPAATTTWRPLGKWAGAGSRQTESFDVVSGALRLQWDARPSSATTGSAPGRFRVTLHSAISGRPLQVVVDSFSPASGTVHIADDPRTSYLVIEAEDVAWTVALDQATATRVRP